MPMMAALAETVESEAVARSGQILTAAGYHLVPLAHAIGGVWQLLGLSPQGGLVLVAVATGPVWPFDLGVRYGALPGWPATRRLLHLWEPEAEWPKVRALP